MGVIVENLREIHQLGRQTREWLVSNQPQPGLVKNARVAGYTEARAGYAFVRHAPAFGMVLVTESGVGEVWVAGEWLPCRAGQAYVTAPRVPHAYHLQPGGRWRLHWVIYEESLPLPTLAPGMPPRLLACEAAGLRRAVEGLCLEKAGRAEPSALGLWSALVDRMVQRVLDPENIEPRLERLWAQVREDLGADWSLPRLARTAGMSEENLRRLCLRQHQRAPMAQLTWLRMQAAADMLAHSQEKLATLAVRLGYADAFAFSTAFRRVMGRPPRAFRAGGMSAH